MSLKDALNKAIQEKQEETVAENKTEEVKEEIVKEDKNTEENIAKKREIDEKTLRELIDDAKLEE